MPARKNPPKGPTMKSRSRMFAGKTPESDVRPVAKKFGIGARIGAQGLKSPFDVPIKAKAFRPKIKLRKDSYVKKIKGLKKD